MNVPKYSPQTALYQLDTLITGWAMYHASEDQLAKLRGIRRTLSRVIDVDTRMEELRKIDADQFTTT